MEIEEKWPNTKNYSNIAPTSMKFVFEQAEKYLKETSDAGNAVVSRTTTLITLVSGMLVGLVGYSINRFQTEKHFDNMIYTALLLIIYLTCIAFVLAKNIRGVEYHISGNPPKSVFIDTIFNYAGTDEDRCTHLYLNEIESYQGKIEANRDKNKKRWQLLDKSLILVVSFPIAMILAYFIVYLFLHDC